MDSIFKGKYEKKNHMQCPLMKNTWNTKIIILDTRNRQKADQYRNGGISKIFQVRLWNTIASEDFMQDNKGQNRDQYEQLKNLNVTLRHPLWNSV